MNKTRRTKFDQTDKNRQTRPDRIDKVYQRILKRFEWPEMHAKGMREVGNIMSVMATGEESQEIAISNSIQ